RGAAGDRGSRSTWSPSSLGPDRGRLEEGGASRYPRAMRTLPPHVFPPTPPVPASLLDDLSAVESREPEAVGRVFAATGKLVGWMDVHGASSGIGYEAFAALLLAPPP